ncbi:MAG: deoxyribose-phosphate aldolase [Candidatus Heimdallarchaeota archaeon]|nr:deoxyribose-phosphate aldolase [Candidatus Heimdallarchaeota archaeon]
MEIDYKAFKLKVTPQEIAQLIDHTKLSAWEGPGSIINLCKEAQQHNFFSVCVNSSYVSLAAQSLENSDVKVCSVVGFPLGMMDSESKAFETKKAVKDGADEIDMVINVGRLKDGDTDFVRSDIESVVTAASNALVKVIIETCYLTDKEKIEACTISKDAGAHFVKTSTGFGVYGAFPYDIKLMRKTVGPNIGVKAAGGIRNFSDAARAIIAGGNTLDPLKFRLGASAGINIMNNLKWMALSDHWIIDEIPCHLCPTRSATFGKMSEAHYSYHKEKCQTCEFIEYNLFYD